jgi:predicted transposase/invertase (TIGR01784 family)
MKASKKTPPQWRRNPMNDFFFYKIFGEKGMEAQLLGFLNAVLGRTGKDKFTSVEILEDKTFSPEVLGDKSTTLDVRAILQGTARVNVEVQIKNEYNMDKRTLFHWGREYVKSLKAGGDYQELPEVITVNIVSFDFPPLRKCHTCFHIREDSEPGMVLTDSLEIHFINMVQYRKLRKKIGGALNGDPLFRWLAWFNKKSPPGLVEEVKRMDSAIQMADDRLAYLSGDEDSIRAYEVRFKAMCDLTSMQNDATETGHAKGFKKGRKEGRAEGMKAGIEQEKLEIARNLKKMGLSLSQIAEGTGLPLETIEQLTIQVKNEQ